MLLVPLLQRNTAIGVLVAFSVRPRAFDETDEHLLELLAVMAAAAVSDFAESETAPRISRSLPAVVHPFPSQPSPL